MYINNEFLNTGFIIIDSVAKGITLQGSSSSFTNSGKLKLTHVQGGFGLSVNFGSFLNQDSIIISNVRDVELKLFGSSSEFINDTSAYISASDSPNNVFGTAVISMDDGIFHNHGQIYVLNAQSYFLEIEEGLINPIGIFLYSSVGTLEFYNVAEDKFNIQTNCEFICQ